MDNNNNTQPQRGFEMPPSSQPPTPQKTSRWPRILDPNGDGEFGPIETGLWAFLIALVVVAAASSVTLAVTDTADLGQQVDALLQILAALGNGGILVGGFLAHRRNKKRSDVSSGMGTISKLGLLFFVAVAVLLTSCSSQSPYVPLLSSTLKASQTPIKLAQEQAVKSASFPGCYAAGALSAALETSSQALESWASAELSQSLFLPGVSVDVSDCIGLEPDGAAPWTLEAAEASVAGYVEGLAPAAFVVARAILGTSGLEACDVAVVGGVLAYLEGALGPVVEELVSPDGVVEVPGVSVGLDACG